ncbi:ComGF family competence protein [Lactobacillus sp. PV034]|uniref:ComGF family competence protein n=1 Tax=Lactobacillus sp. PV034 TaxID=2594495 RepID=UPI002240052D|nr:ComGF family competence protein [Lactobacillus sp. PV034]QNQ80678.1 competence protein ComGE [Lactobacillus sp. PV034]
MMKKYTRLLGFSVAEAILALLITALCIEMLIGILGCLKNANRKRAPINEVAFSYIQLEKFLKEEGHVEVDTGSSNSREIILKKKIGEKNKRPEFKIYSLEKYDDMIRMTGYQRGHMPLLLNIKRASFKCGEDFFEIQVIEQDKRKSNLRFKTDKPLKIEEKTKKKDIKNKDRNKTNEQYLSSNSSKS